MRSRLQGGGTADDWLVALAPVVTGSVDRMSRRVRRDMHGSTATVGNLVEDRRHFFLDAPSPTIPSVTVAEELAWARSRFGLTWDQLSKVLGVSRRSLHLWAAGAAPSSENEQAVHLFVQELRRLDVPDPAQRRAALFTPGTDGRTVLDRARARYALGGDDDLTGRTFAPQNLLGNRQGDVARP